MEKTKLAPWEIELNKTIEILKQINKDIKQINNDLKKIK
jgi:hypothetical protein